MAMAKTWVLDTETKGTGAHVVPLDKGAQPARREELAVAPRGRQRTPKPSAPPEPRAPRLFKVIDVTTREVLAEGVEARETVRTLETVRSMVDVHIFVWAPKAERWRLLTLGEQQTLWGFRGRLGSLDRRPVSADTRNV
jgi:hypothetical protein